MEDNKEVKVESDVRACKTCGQLKQRIFIGKYDLKNKKFADESGSLWNGRNCPDCHRNRLKEHMRKKRIKDNPPF